MPPRQCLCRQLAHHPAAAWVCWRRLALDREAELTLQPNYLRNHDESVQPEHYINAEMRKLTVGWMGEVVREFGLCQETLFLACGLFDRFLSCSKVGDDGWGGQGR